jgi:AraC-like DNA-binding protein
VKTTRTLLILHTDELLLRQLVRVGDRLGWGLQTVSSWDALFDGVRAANVSALLVVDPYMETNGDHLSIELASLLNRFPSLSVTAALALRPGRLDDLRRLGDWGVVQIIDLDEEATEWAMAHRLRSSTGRPLRVLVERALPSYTGGAARSILGAAVENTITGGTGVDLAKALHITTRTLLRWCRKAGLPPPRRLLVWMRMLLAAELLDDLGRSVSEAALACGYSSDGSLRNAMRSLLGRSPSDLREMGAFAATSEAFVQDLRRARSPTARYRAESKKGASTASSNP